MSEATKSTHYDNDVNKKLRIENKLKCSWKPINDFEGLISIERKRREFKLFD